MTKHTRVTNTQATAEDMARLPPEALTRRAPPALGLHSRTLSCGLAVSKFL